MFTFDLLLCDNEIDRDFERFSADAISGLCEMFLGRTGIFDHTWSAHGQKARIYKTQVIEDPSKITSYGEPYIYLKASAYMLRNAENEALIDDIRSGIKKEVSIGCSVKEITCNICGEPDGSPSCSHIRGAEYDGVICCRVLNEPTDAYEWSFVAVPAQRDAGVMKRFSGAADDDAIKRLEKEADLGRMYLGKLRDDTAKSAVLVLPELNEDILRSVLSKLDEKELMSLGETLKKRADKLYPPVCQLKYQREQARDKDENYYKI
ncbi:MAG: hypothetical protein IJL71_02155 [Oscillospiraceae bacterium]|nr:hypothetical protein [Oscillospiraceae bacterium]